MVERLRLGEYSGAYLLILLIALYAVLMPETFLSATTLRTILIDQSVIGILAVAAVVPLVAGLIDISFASLAGFSLVFMTWLTVNTDYDFFLSAGIAVLATVLLGSVSAFMVAVMRLDSLIVTLGLSTVALGIGEGISHGSVLVGQFDPRTVNVIQGSWGPLPFVTVLFLGLAAATYVWLEHTVSGRNLHSCGSNSVAARLAGISVVKYRFGAMIFAALISGMAGVLLAARIGSAAPTTGAAYLLPALAVIFFGATQVHRHVNIPGLLLAAAVIGTLIKGLQLAGAAAWVSPLANGVVLLLALSTTARAARRAEQQS